MYAVKNGCIVDHGHRRCQKQDQHLDPAQSWQAGSTVFQRKEVTTTNVEGTKIINTQSIASRLNTALTFNVSAQHSAGIPKARPKTLHTHIDFDD
jgi:hypothetical protein